MSRTRSLALGFLLVLLVRVLATEPPRPEGGPLVLRGATLRTQTEAGDFVGTVVIRDGKITALGRDVPIPADARILDLPGCVITPGLIDANGALGLQAAAAKEGGREAALDILDAVDPFADDWRDAARQGITAVYVQPGGSGSLGGSGAVLSVSPGDTAGALAVRSPAAVQASLGATPPAPSTQPTGGLIPGGRGGLPFAQPQAAPTPAPSANSLTRYAQFETLRAQFEAAKKYGESKPTSRDPAKELLLRTIKKEIPVILEVSHEDDLRNAARLGPELGPRVIFTRVDRARALPQEWKALRAPLIIGPLHDAGKASAELRSLALDGRPWALGTFADSPRVTMGLRLHAAAAVASGYPREAVLTALTRGASDLLGVGDRLGRLAPGRTADLAVFAGDPLDASTPVRLTLSRGLITWDNPSAVVTPLTLTTQPTLPAKLPPSYTLKSRRLLTPAGEFTEGSLSIVEGRVAPPGAPTSLLPVFDVGQAPITPGLVAAHVSVVGEATPDADASHLRALDGLASDDARVRNLRDAGVLRAVLAPNAANVLAGVSGFVDTADVTSSREVGLKLVLTSAARTSERTPDSLGGQLDLLGARLSGAPATTDLFLPSAIRAKLLAERDGTLRAVREGRLSATFEAHSRAEVRAALRLMSRHKVRGVLLMPRDVDDVRDEIRAAGIGVVVGSQRPQDETRIAGALAALGALGVPLAFAGEAGEMRTSAAWLVNHGLARSAARRGLLAQPPTAFGLPEGTGGLGAGAAADLVIWDGDPVDPASRPVAVLVRGQRVAGKP